MSITINGTGSITGLTAGGLPDASITSDDIAAGAVTAAKLSTGAPSWTSGGDLSFNSGYGSVATAYGVRAWANFQGTGVVDIRKSGNCSSITDLGTGYYQFNFSSMVDESYAVTGSVISSTNSDSTYAFIGGAINAANSVHTSSAFRFSTVHFSGAAIDYNHVQIVVVR